MDIKRERKLLKFWDLFFWVMSHFLCCVRERKCDLIVVENAVNKKQWITFSWYIGALHERSTALLHHYHCVAAIQEQDRTGQRPDTIPLHFSWDVISLCHADKDLVLELHDIRRTDDISFFCDIEILKYAGIMTWIALLAKNASFFGVILLGSSFA